MDGIGQIIEAIHDKHDQAVDQLSIETLERLGGAEFSSRAALNRYFNDRMVLANKTTAALRAARTIEKFLG